LQSPEVTRGLRRSALAISCTLIIAFALTAFGRWHAGRGLAQATETMSDALPIVDTIVVRSSGSGGDVSLPGETAAWYQSTIYARVSGYVARWNVDIGDSVTQGQTLAEIDTPELDAELTAAQARLEVADATVRVDAAAADLARTTYARWRESPKGVVSDQERETKKAEDAAAQAQLEAAGAQVRLDQADVDRLRALTRFKRVTAPYTGTIIRRQIDIGDLVTAGSSNNTTPLFSMVQQDPLRILVEVPQNLAGDLMKDGVAARISTSDGVGPAIAAVITRTSDAIDPKTRTFQAQIDVPNHDERLVPGQYVKVDFNLASRGFRSVPAAALVFRSGSPHVAVLTPAGVVHFRAVTIARDDGASVEVNAGVSTGDRLVLNISNRIAEGDRVQAATGPEAAVAMRGL
jgi:RND family efflux transporter MFP subunit